MPKRARDKNAAAEDSPERRPSEILNDYQEAGSYLHEKLQKELSNFYRNHADDENLFEQYFAMPVLNILSGSHGSPFVKKLVSCVVDFLVQRLGEEDEDEEREEMSPFIKSFFALFWKVQGLDDKNLRYNVCKILADLLTKLAEKDISMDESLCDKISVTMISERMTDKAVDVRELAAQVLQWLQDSSNPNCHVTKTLMFHLDRDPSVDVRKTILSIIRVSAITLPSIVRRTRDVNEAVRIKAFKMLAERRKLTSLSYSLREKIIMSGLNDSSPAVRETTETYLLPKWLENMNGDLIEFVNNLDVHFNPLVPKNALPHLFKNKTPDELVAFLKVPEGEIYPSYENLTAPLALYWSCLVKYFKDEQLDDYVDKILGTVSQLTNYVNCFYTEVIPRTEGVTEKEKEQKVLMGTNMLFLLDLFLYCDFTDEVGRQNMTKMFLDILKDKNEKPDRRLLTKVTSLLTVGIPDPYQRVETVVEMLHDMYNPTVQTQAGPTVPVLTDEQKRSIALAIAHLKKNLCNKMIALEQAVTNEQFKEADELKQEVAKLREDLKAKEDELKGPVVLESQDEALEREETTELNVQYTCLVILCELLRSEDVVPVSLGFADIMENFVMQKWRTGEEHIVLNCLEAACLYSMHSEFIARAKLPMFYVMLINDVNPYDSVQSKCLQCIATLLIHYGREKLDIPAEDWTIHPNATKFNATVRDIQQMGFLNCVVNAMSSESDNVKRHAIIGACQLLLSGRVVSADLLAKIILLWFLPATGNSNFLLKQIGQFLSHYAATINGAPEMLTSALLIAIDDIVNCAHSSDLQELDPKEVGLFILDLTKPQTNKYTDENTHDMVAMRLMEKLEFEDNEEAQAVYLRLLVNLMISYDDKNVTSRLLEILRRIKNNQLQDSKNKDLLRMLINLQERPEPASQNVSMEEFSSTPRASVTNVRRTLISDNMITPIRPDVDEMMDSDDEDVFKTPLSRSTRA